MTDPARKKYLYRVTVTDSGGDEQPRDLIPRECDFGMDPETGAFVAAQFWPPPGRTLRHYLTSAAAKAKVAKLADNGVTATITRSDPITWDGAS